MKLSGLAQQIAPIKLPTQDTSGATAGSSFSDVMKGAIGEIETSRGEADQGVQNFLTGEGDDLHSVVLATQRAELEFDMFLQVRNKVVSAYQEIMRMQM